MYPPIVPRICGARNLRAMNYLRPVHQRAHTATFGVSGRRRAIPCRRAKHIAVSVGGPRCGRPSPRNFGLPVSMRRRVASARIGGVGVVVRGDHRPDERRSERDDVHESIAARSAADRNRRGTAVLFELNTAWVAIVLIAIVGGCAAVGIVVGRRIERRTRPMPTSSRSASCRARCSVSLASYSPSDSRCRWDATTLVAPWSSKPMTSTRPLCKPSSCPSRRTPSRSPCSRTTETSPSTSRTRCRSPIDSTPTQDGSNRSSTTCGPPPATPSSPTPSAPGRGPTSNR